VAGFNVVAYWHCKQKMAGDAREEARPESHIANILNDCAKRARRQK
jgi:hypothetical protein